MKIIVKTQMTVQTLTRFHIFMVSLSAILFGLVSCSNRTIAYFYDKHVIYDSTLVRKEKLTFENYFSQRDYYPNIESYIDTGFVIYKVTDYNYNLQSYKRDTNYILTPDSLFPEIPPFYPFQIYFVDTIPDFFQKKRRYNSKYFRSNRKYKYERMGDSIYINTPIGNGKEYKMEQILQFSLRKSDTIRSVRRNFGLFHDVFYHSSTNTYGNSLFQGDTVIYDYKGNRITTHHFILKLDCRENIDNSFNLPYEIDLYIDTKNYIPVLYREVYFFEDCIRMSSEATYRLLDINSKQKPKPFIENIQDGKCVICR